MHVMTETVEYAVYFWGGGDYLVSNMEYVQSKYVHCSLAAWNKLKN